MFVNIQPIQTENNHSNNDLFEIMSLMYSTTYAPQTSQQTKFQQEPLIKKEEKKKQRHFRVSRKKNHISTKRSSRYRIHSSPPILMHYAPVSCLQRSENIVVFKSGVTQWIDSVYFVSSTPLQRRLFSLSLLMFWVLGAVATNSYQSMCSPKNQPEMIQLTR